MPPDTPAVALLVFDRPELTRIVFERIRQMRPRVLMVIADGPRAGRPDEAARCAAARRAAERVDWPCELVRNYSEVNLGCGRRVASGLDWVFATVEEAIILEDDCLPEPSFFRFCAELLERYRGDGRVMQISGCNFLFSRRFTDCSYYFSRYPHCWGWATWRRAWKNFDFSMRTWKADPWRCLSAFQSPAERAFWRTVWDAVAEGSNDTWDYQWALAHLDAGGLAATPATSLVSNLGIGSYATHTRARLFALRPTVAPLVFPLRHPQRREANDEADRFTARRMFCRRSSMGKAAEALARTAFGALAYLRAGRAEAAAFAPQAK